MAEPRELDALLELARGAEPPALGALKARRMVRHAQLAAAERGQRRKAASYALLCAAVLLALVAGYAWQRAPAGTNIAVGASDRPLRIALKTGDSLLLAPGSELGVLEQRTARRCVRLTRGRVLFDVAKLGAGFEVQTETARVRVLGTIFSVEVGEGRTLVRVYEGRVAVGERVVAAPGSWVSRGAPPQQGDALFEHEARQLVRARHAAQRAASQPVAEPVPPPVQRVAPAQPAPSGAPPPALAPSEPPVDPAIHVTAPPRATSAPSATLAAAALAPPVAPQASAPSHSPAQRSDSGAAGTESSAKALPAVVAGAVFDIDRARVLLATGDARGAMQIVREHAPSDDEALLLLADASRAIGHLRKARTHYLALAERSAGPLRARAAFAAAQLALHALHDPADALASIATFALAADNAPLRERATALEVEALLALGRRNEARFAAQRYLAREPETETSQRMRELLGE